MSRRKVTHKLAGTAQGYAVLVEAPCYVPHFYAFDEDGALVWWEFESALRAWKDRERAYPGCARIVSIEIKPTSVIALTEPWVELLCARLRKETAELDTTIPGKNP